MGLMAMVQAVLFLLLVLSYISVFTTSSIFLFDLLGAATLTVRRVFAIKRPARQFSQSFLLTSEALIIAAWLLSFLELNLQRYPWIKLWESPLLTCLVYFYSGRLSALSGSYNPILKAMSKGAPVYQVTTLLVLITGLFMPQAIHQKTFFSAFVTAAAMRILLVFIVGIRQIKALRSFEQLDQRHDQLGYALRDLNAISGFTAESDQWQEVRESLSWAKQCYDKAFEYMKARRVGEAEGQLIQGETEIAKVDKLFKTELRGTFRESMTARLASAENTIMSLKAEVTFPGMSAAQLDRISDRIAELGKMEFDPANLSYSELADKVRPIADLIGDIDDLRTALRFQHNFDAAIYDLEKELDEKWITVKVATALGVDVKKCEVSRALVADGLNKFRSGAFSTSEDVVKNYRSLQNALSDFNRDLGAVLGEIANFWTRKQTENPVIETYVPRRCSTSEPVTGVIVLSGGDVARQTSVNLVGTLLELQSETKLDVSSSPDNPAIRPFQFAGKKGGRGTLTVFFSGSQSHRCSALSSKVA